MNIRVGFGFDVHPFAEGRECWLGGVLIPSDIGPAGHSDADVLIHAICDSLLGAAGLRDIGQYFPNSSESFKGIDSKLLLQEVYILLRERGYRIGNIDATLCLEAPYVNAHIDAMKLCLASILNLSTEDIGIKATTNEKLGYIGRGEGLSAYSVCLLYKE
jgi:2-C-methyl-D-erythritol 2,4-cyclodiphosphate synthase